MATVLMTWTSKAGCKPALRFGGIKMRPTARGGMRSAAPSPSPEVLFSSVFQILKIQIPNALGTAASNFIIHNL
jgi:hypothetical protein